MVFAFGFNVISRVFAYGFLVGVMCVWDDRGSFRVLGVSLGFSLRGYNMVYVLICPFNDVLL